MLPLFHPQTLQDWILLVLGLGETVLVGFALLDALRHAPAAFPAAGKQTKQRWLLILGVAAIPIVLVLTGIIGPLSFLVLGSVIAGAVYCVDVRPAVGQFRGGKGRGRSGGSSW